MGFGLASVILCLYLLERGFTKSEVGVLLTATLIQDALLTTAFSALASKLDSKRLLFWSSAIMFVGAIILAFAQDKWLLATAVICGIISPAGFEGGPFAALEQSIIAHSQQAAKLTKSLSTYNMLGFGGAALGALLAGVGLSQMKSLPTVEAYQILILVYAFCAPLLAVLYAMLNTKWSAEQNPVTPAQCVSREPDKSTSKERFRIWQLAGLQSIDAFGGGFVVQSMLTLWFYQQYQVDATFLGNIFFWCNIIAAASFMVAPIVAKRFGLLQTMVFTHLPCSLTLCLLPFLPSAELAAGLLVLRSFFSSMDIPVRQAYAMLLVAEKDRAFAAGLTSSSRAMAQAIAPTISGILMQHFLTSTPLVFAGVCKSAYDLLLFFSFKNVPLSGGEQNLMQETQEGKSAISEAKSIEPALASNGARR